MRGAIFLTWLIGLAGCNQTAAAHRKAGPPPAGCTGGTVTHEVVLDESGVELHGVVSNPCGGAPRPVVVLAHQMCKDHREWGDWVTELGNRGIATLAIDLRGHGASKTWKGGATHDLCKEIDDDAAQPLYAGMVDDVAAAVTYARASLGAPKVAIVGSSIGANSALVVAARDPQVAAVVALSPGLDYRGIKPEPSKIAAPHELLAADDDKRSAEAVRAFGGRVLPDGGHGNAMLAKHPEELDRLVAAVAAAL
jgi:alpha-beta hydrolase superfamily lysophospholipase